MAKGKCYSPPHLEKHRVWGFTVQLYGLRSRPNWGIGDFGDLRALVDLSVDLGAGFVGVSPLHATSGRSPYSPSSRHALYALYIDVDSLPEAFPGVRKERGKAIGRLQAASLVDHEAVRRMKYAAFEALFRRLEDRRGLERFRRAASRGVRTYALYEALRERFGGAWQGWPGAYRDPDGAAVRAFARRHARRIDFHLWLQWRAREQLDAVQRHALARGMPIGLYVDLALGCDGGGAEAWADQAAFAPGMSIGAPPDEFNPLGQDWGLPPYSPRALAAARYRPFVDLLRANMPEGGALRMDHVMALMRLWWIPRGNRPEAGGYVRYPFRDLLAILAAQSRERRCLVVGEDLGTVLPQFRRALNAAGVLSYRPLLFEKAPGGGFAAPGEFPREALACVTTHDLPTWKGFFARHDLKLRKDLGLSVDPGKEVALRKQDADGLHEALGREGMDGSALSAHRYLARTPAKLMAVQPEDVFELTEQANLPGTVEQHPNWARKLPLALEDWAGDPRVRALAEALSPLRRAGKRVPRATYRLQLHEEFRFADATRLVPYLAALGVSHLYASPFLAARPGSRHGYDVVDPNRLNPEIGTEADLRRLLDALRRHGMGLVMDIVPNHMGVLQGDNPWWRDVLEKGRASRYGRFFDIDWMPAKAELRGKVLLPVLGDHYGAVLERGELKLAKEQGKWGLRYFDHRLPLSEKTTRRLRKTNDPLALHKLLERQHYRVAFWRVASDEINYRRFFEITDLAALRQEEPAVFDATHVLVRRLCRMPGVDGLRIDHPDGLADPKGYFERLNAACGEVGGPPWVVVEKIVAGHESLPADWPVAGTTGYRFANLLTGVFIAPAAEGRFDRTCQRFTGERRGFDEIAYESRRLVMDTTLAAELAAAAARLARIAAGNRFTRDYTESGLRKALAEVAAHFPVYRTYVTARGPAEADRRHIDWAIGRARRASRIADPGVFDFIRSTLLLEVETKSPQRRKAMLDFVTRFQQVTAPVVAKGVEDTAFYRYHRLVALNEVGNEPGRFGFSLKAFHAAAEDRAKSWPHTMLASSTHDTKRSEDVRARLGVLSEMPSAWRLMLRRWSKMNRARRLEVNGAPAPSASDEYLYYQSTLGIWPIDGASPQELPGLKDRLGSYMLKAAREAKQRTSWINPDAEYEAALQRFIHESLDNPLFVTDLGEAARRIGRLGLLVGLSQALLKVASPGVPDYYQGTELFDFSLVDPDNRRPVDYRHRIDLLKGLSFSEGLLADLGSGRAKLHVIREGLRLRKALPELFYRPAYSPLHADGGREENVVAFALSLHARRVVAVAPRLFARLMEDGDFAPLGERAWAGARLALPEGHYANVLTGEEIQAGSEGVRVADLLRRFPVSLLVDVPRS